MADDEDDDSKTEEPSQKKLEDARKRGQSISTRELNHFFLLGALLFFSAKMAPGIGQRTIDQLASFVTRPESYETDAASIFQILREVLLRGGALIGLTLLLACVAALAPSILQGKWVAAVENITPKLEKISPLSGLKRVFGKKALVEFLKNLVKVTIVGFVCWLMVRPLLVDLPGLMGTPPEEMLHFTGRMLIRMILATVLFLFLLSIIDYLYQRFTFLKSLRMSKQEVKEEYKQQEGDPHYKQKLRQMRSERARKRMMANVPKADVVITNPTHYAVALKFDAATMAVPKVLAKGVDEVAARIREVAQQHRIIILRNPPLARVLYDTVEIDEDIPEAQFRAVAKIIGYVYRLKGKKIGAAPEQGSAKQGGNSRRKR